MYKVPTMFNKDNSKIKKPSDNKALKNTDKMDLIKSINSSEI